jgi:hypothetical protein
VRQRLELLFPPLGPILSDLDGDGLADLVIARRSAGEPAWLLVLGADGQGGLRALSQTTLGGVHDLRIVREARLDDDPHTDLVLFDQTARRLFWLHGDGAGGFRPVR